MMIWALQSARVTSKITYYLNALDGTEIQALIARKTIKLFERGEDIVPNFIEHEDEDLLEGDQNVLV